ncbi:MAG TPA: SCO family protein [Vicinamibacteria bacterium]|nr:SCO family protein [Vicinamibacteria bacterium]
MTRSLVVLAATLSLGALAGSASAWVRDQPSPAPPAGETPKILRDIGFDQRLGDTVPLDATFRDESGRTVKLGDYFGQRPVVLALAYYDCPMLCTVTLNGLASAMDVLAFDPGRDFEIVTVSFEPKETPELAAAKKAVYLRRYHRPGAAAAWHFLTGDAAQIHRLTEAVGFRYAWDEPTKQYAHASGIMVLTADGRLARYLYGVEYAPKDLRFAIVEASQGKILSPVDRLLLYCYHYDPTRGRYGTTIMAVLRVAGILTVAGLGALMIVLRRREASA